MIDGISFRIPTELLRDNRFLEFRGNGNRREAKYRGLKINSYTDGITNISGSIHKFYNNGEHNSDDFHLSKYVYAINELSAILNINPDATRFNKFEFGVNVLIPVDVKTFTEALIYPLKGIRKMDSLGIAIELSEYIIKAYVKQTNDNLNVLRFEIRINKARNIRNRIEQQGRFCSTLLDLADADVWKILGEILIEAYDKFQYLDIDSLTDVSNDEYKWLYNVSKSSYWLKKWSNAKTKQREIDRLQKYIKEHSTSTTFDDVRYLIIEKTNSLIDDVIKSQSVMKKSPPPKKGKMAYVSSQNYLLNLRQKQVVI